MIAYRLVQPQELPQLQDVAKPSPGAGQLLIKVGGCGLCYTDIGLIARTKAEWLDNRRYRGIRRSDSRRAARCL